MSVFSEKFQEYVTGANIKVAALSKLSGVERSFIQKMLTGERIPSDPAVLQPLAATLMLTPNQRRILTEAYSITKMGEATYYRRVLVKRLIEETGQSMTIPPAIPSEESLPSERFIEPVRILQGSGPVADGIDWLLEQELTNQNRELLLVCQPECEGIIQRVAHFCRTRPELSVYHIICFDSELQYQKENRYNLQCLQKSMPLLMGAAKYVPYFFYESVSARMGASSVLPCMAVIGERTLSFSADGETALTFQGVEIAEFYRRIFEALREESRPILASFSEEADPAAGGPWLDTSWYLQYAPPLQLFCSPDMLRKQLREDLSNREAQLERLISQLKPVSLLRGERQNISFFTETGLREFLEAGQIFAFSGSSLVPFPRAFRIELVRRMTECAQKGFFTPYLIQEQKFRFPRDFGVSVERLHQVWITLCHPVRGMMRLFFCEKSLAFSFRDFMEYLQETGLIIPKEESFQRIKKLLEDYAAK